VGNKYLSNSKHQCNKQKSKQSRARISVQTNKNPSNMKAQKHAI